jgi:DASH complex subunit DAD3
MAGTPDFQASTTSHHGDYEDEESLTPLEQEVLDEYARLLGNLNDVCAAHHDFSTHTYLGTLMPPD